MFKMDTLPTVTAELKVTETLIGVCVHMRVQYDLRPLSLCVRQRLIALHHAIKALNLLDGTIRANDKVYTVSA